MSNIFVTSDLHFGHKNIIRYSKRPYTDLDDMESCFIKTWNVLVGATDTVYILGDFAFCPKTKAQEILMRLNGFKRFVWGNHDRGREKAYCEVPGVTGIDLERINYDGSSIIMTHYPFESFREDYHFHGHTHGQSVAKARRIDVGVDSIGYRPYTIRQVLDRVNHRDKEMNLVVGRY